MYEVEYKVEITKDEREKLIDLFKKENFTAKESIHINDFYFDLQNSPFGGYNFKRYRDEGKKIIYTEKVWENIGDTKGRRETEKEVSRGELESEINKHPDILKIKKDRISLDGKYQDNKIHIDLDSVKFDHSPKMQYFIEAEILTQNKEEVKVSRDLVIEFLRSSLGREEINEAPGMFKMALDKL